MAAQIVTVSPPNLIWAPTEIERLWYFPNGSEYLRYSPHFHIITRGGFRQNLPLVHMFVVIMEGKLSVKEYHGKTSVRIDVRDQVWYVRGSDRPAKSVYATMLQKRHDLLGRSHLRTRGK